MSGTIDCDIKQIGTGTFSEVYRIKECAVKIYNKEDLSDIEIPIQFIRETTSLAKLKDHPNVIKLLDIKIEGDFRLYFREAGWNLQQYKKAKAEIGQIINIKDVSYQILSGLYYCHSNGITHGDIKPHNILVYKVPDSNGGGNNTSTALKNKYVICDFGTSQKQMCYMNRCEKEVTTLWWRAPEILLGDTNYNEKIDIWSLGVIMAEEFGVQMRGNGEYGQLHVISKHLGTPTNESYPGVDSLHYHRLSIKPFTERSKAFTKAVDETQGLLGLLLTWKPNRITAWMALNHQYYNDIPADDIQPELPDINTRPKPTQEIKIYNDDILELYKWMFDVLVEFNLQYRTLFRAYAIMDNILRPLENELDTIKKKMLYINTSAVICIVGAMYEEIYLEIDDIIKFAKSKEIFTVLDKNIKEEIIDIQKKILIEFNFNLPEENVEGKTPIELMDELLKVFNCKKH